MAPSESPVRHFALAKCLSSALVVVKISWRIKSRSEILDIIIDFLKGKKEAIETFKKNINEICSTEINRFEILYGIYAKEHINNRELTIANDFFNSITVFPFDEGCAEIAAKILTGLKKEGRTIHQNDALIASIILKNGLSTIITKNTKHFSIIKGIKAVQY